MEHLLYNVGPVEARSMPFWPVENCLMDPFGVAVLPPISSMQACEIICDAAKEGLIEMTGFHDDDLVPWNPEEPEDDLDSKSAAYGTIQQIKQKLGEVDVAVNTATCNLHSGRIFQRGGLTNPDPRIRDLARLKVERTLRIGNVLNAQYFTYWVARDGWEVVVKTPWSYVCYPYPSSRTLFNDYLML